MKLIAGLGNPGIKFEGTRHNIGFEVIEQLRQEFDFRKFKEEKKFRAEISIGSHKKKKIALVKPLTFMNNSGLAIKKIKDYYKINQKDVWIIHDDSDLEIGKIKISYKRGSAGHNGVRSIISALKSNGFFRFRIGIGPASEKNHKKALDLVFQKYSDNEKETIENSKKTIVESVKRALDKNPQIAMNEFNA